MCLLIKRGGKCTYKNNENREQQKETRLDNIQHCGHPMNQTPEHRNTIMNPDGPRINQMLVVESGMGLDQCSL